MLISLVVLSDRIMIRGKEATSDIKRLVEKNIL
jgi:hypothetical protein